MDQKWHSLDLQKLIITQITEVIKHNATYFWIPLSMHSLLFCTFFLFMFLNLSFSVTAQSIKPNKTEQQSFITPAQSVLGIQCQLLPLLVGNAS